MQKRKRSDSRPGDSQHKRVQTFQKMSRQIALERMAVLEKKGVDTALAETTVIATTNTNGDSYVVNAITPGTASYQRVGRKVHLKSLRIRGVAINDFGQATSLQYGNILRMVVVWDKQPSGTLPTFDTIFGRTVAAGTESSSFLDAVRYDNMNRFKVLRDKCIMWVPPIATSAGAGNQQMTEFDEYIKLNGLETVFSGQTDPTTIADISSGGLYLFFRVYSSSSATTVNIASAYARLRYVD